ncbi:MAG: SPOR domain-containing protein [Candidatus Fibromonas sp.]|jgi:DNA-binding Lrp family transcriptional regulator|nr:SPOR domain-containing protein [Candidatus Fibromonas sp.]
MRRNFVLASVVVYSVLFFACEEEAIPVSLPPPLPTAQTTDDVELLPPPSDNTPSNNTPSNNIASPAPSEMKRMAPSFIDEPEEFGGSEQLKSGRYTIQVVLFPSESSAKKLVKKMEENGIRAYYAKVDNPNNLYGTYYRVRVGYFKDRTAATAFAKTRLEPLGYAWWVDNARNDNVPKPGGSVSSTPAPSKPATVALDPELERAKQEYKEFAKAAAAEKEAKQRQQTPPPPPAKAAPPPAAKAPPPPPPAKAKTVVQEGTTGEMEVDNRGKVRIKKKKKK